LKKVVYITNIPVPYRYKLYEKFTNQSDYEGWIFFHALSYGDVDWGEEFPNNIRYKVLDGIKLKSNDGITSFSIKVYTNLLKLKPDTIILSDFSPLMVLQVLLYRILVNRKVKIISTTDENEKLFENLSNRRIRYFFRKLLLWNASHSICASVKGEEHIRKIANIPTTVCYLTPEHKYYLKSINLNLELHNKEITIVSVGRFVEYKRFDRLLRAAYILNKSSINVPWKVVLVGDGPENNNLRKLVKKFGLEKQIVFKGRLVGDTLVETYLSSDIFVLLSEFEAWGVTVHEAMLCGLACVVTKSIGSSELVEQCGGIVIEDEGREEKLIIDDIASNLIKLITNSSNLRTLKKKSYTLGHSITIDNQINRFISTFN
jgi:glycosyltransferase involved in cell wall biosynthesis